VNNYTSSCSRQFETDFSESSIPVKFEIARGISENFKTSLPSSENFDSYVFDLKQIICDPNQEVRKIVANVLQDCHHLPNEIAFQLCMDVVEVCEQILANSPVLKEQDLLKILLSSAHNKQVIIAKRNDLTCILAKYIFENAELGSILSCLANQCIPININAVETLFNRFPDHSELQHLLVEYDNLSEPVIARLHQLLPTALRKILLKQNPPPFEMEEVILSNRKEAALADRIIRTNNISQKRKAAHQLHEDGRLTGTIILRLLVMGDEAFFLAGMAETIGFPEKYVIKQMHSQQQNLYKKLLQKTAFPVYILPALKIAITKHFENNDLPPSQQKMVSYIAETYNCTRVGTLEKLMEHLRPQIGR
jgi:uncharacterized protein (DUF2336 family)